MAVSILTGALATGNLPIAIGVLVAATVYGYLKGRDRPKSPFDTTGLLGRTRRLPEADAQRVIGNARTGGIVLCEDDRQWPKTGGADGPSDDQRTRYLYSGRLLSEGPIAGIERIWYDDIEIPLMASGTRGFQSADGRLTARINALITRQNALIPGSVVMFRQIDSVLATADPVARLLWDDLQVEIDALNRSNNFNPTGSVTPSGYSRKSGWVHTWASGSAPAFRTTYGNGTDADAMLTSQVLARAKEKFPRWRDTDIVSGISWAFNEFRLWERENDSEQLELVPFPENTVPTLEFLVRGDPAIASANPEHGANPVKVAQKLLTEWIEDPIPAANLIDFDAAALVCDQLLTIPAVSRTDPADPTSARPITGPQVLASFYGTSLPSTSVQDRVLAEWNLREAGADNARPRYCANGIIDSSMSRDDILDGLGACMGGVFVEMGGKWYARPGQTRSSVLTIVEEDPAPAQSAVYGGPILWQPDAGAGQAPNSLSTTIAQDRERGWSQSDVLPVDDTTNVTRDGLYRQNIGGFSFVNDQLDARRLLHLYLRRDSYGLRRAGWTMNTPTSDHAASNLVPDDIVTLQADGLILRMRLISVRYEPGVVHVEAIESPEDVFEPTFHLPTTSRDFTIQPPPPEDFDLRIRFEAIWRADPAEPVHRLDLVPTLGADVGSIRVQIDVTHARGAMTGDAISYDYVIGQAPPSGGAVTAIQGTGTAISLPTDMTPLAPVASFDQNDEWDIAIKLTSYSERPYTTAGAGEEEGPIASKTLKGPGIPGTGVAGLTVTYETIDRPGDFFFSDGSTSTVFSVIHLQTQPTSATLVWRFSDETAWREAGPHDTTTPTDRNYSWIRSRSAITTPGIDTWTFTIPRFFELPTTTDAVLFAARTGTPGTLRALTSPGTVAKVADITGPIATDAILAMAIDASGNAFAYSRGTGTGAAAQGKLWSVDLATAAFTQVGSGMTNDLRTIWFDGTTLRGFGLVSGSARLVVIDTTSGAVTSSSALTGGFQFVSTSLSPFASANGNLYAFGAFNQGFAYTEVDVAAGSASSSFEFVSAGRAGDTPPPAGLPTGSTMFGAASDFESDSVLLLHSSVGDVSTGAISRYKLGENSFSVVASLPSKVSTQTASALGVWDALGTYNNIAYCINRAGELYQVTGLVNPGTESVNLMYGTAQTITLAKDITPAQSNRIVTAKPTTRGVDGQMAWVIEAE